MNLTCRCIGRSPIIIISLSFSAYQENFEWGDISGKYVHYDSVKGQMPNTKSASNKPGKKNLPQETGPGSFWVQSSLSLKHLATI